MATNPQYNDLFKQIAETLVTSRTPAAPKQPSTPLDSLVARGPSTPTPSQPLSSMGERESDWNLGQGFIDFLSTGTYLTAGAGQKIGENVQSIQQGDIGGALDLFNPISNLAAGVRGIDSRRTWSDNLKDWEVPEGNTAFEMGAIKMNQRDLAGLALDIALDPIWLIPGGAIAAGVKGTYQGSKLASSATATGVALTKPSVEAARNITRSANEARLAARQQPVTTQQLVGGFNKEGKVVGDARLGEVLEGTGNSLGAFSKQGLSNLVQGVKLGNADAYANWSAVRALTKQDKAAARAAKASGAISSDVVKINPDEVIPRDRISEFLPGSELDPIPKPAAAMLDDTPLPSERQANLIEESAELAAEAQKAPVAVADLLPSQIPEEIIRGYRERTAKALYDLQDTIVDSTRVISSPVAGTRVYSGETLAKIESDYSRIAKIRNNGPLSPVTLGVVKSLDELRSAFSAADPTAVTASLTKIAASAKDDVGTVLREALDTPMDVTDLLESALRAEGRPLADVPAFRRTTWNSPSEKYGKPAFSVAKIEKYFPDDELLRNKPMLDIAMGEIPLDKVRAYTKPGETKAQAVARRQEAIWDKFRARNHDQLAAVRAQERADWLALNSIPGSELFIRLEDGSFLGRGLLPAGFPAKAITVHNGRPVTTVGAMLDEFARGVPAPTAISKWISKNLQDIRSAAMKAGVKTPRGPLSAAEETLIAEKLLKGNKSIRSLADARLIAQMGAKGLAMLSTAPKRKYYIDAPLDSLTGLPMAATARRAGGEPAALDLGKLIASAGRESTADSILNQGRAAIGGVTDSIRNGELIVEPAQAAVLSSLLRDLGVKISDNASPQQVFAKFKREAMPRYEEIAQRLQAAAKIDSLAPQLEQVFKIAASERVSMLKAVDKMDPANAQKELRVLVDDLADSIDDFCRAKSIGGPSGV